MPRVKVFNPDSVEMVQHYVETHLDKLDDIIEGVTHKELAHEYKRTFESVQLDATGSGQIMLNGRVGYDRVLERVTTIVSGATVGNMGLFVNGVTPANLLEIVGNQQQTVTIANLGQVVAYADAFNNDIHLSYAEKLIVQFSGYVANGIANINLQEKYLKQFEHTHRGHAFNTGNA